MTTERRALRAIRDDCRAVLGLRGGATEKELREAVRRHMDIAEEGMKGGEL